MKMVNDYYQTTKKDSKKKQLKDIKIFLKKKNIKHEKRLEKDIKVFMKTKKKKDVNIIWKVKTSYLIT